ncbi:hypothetical protein RhiirA5_431437 [Rhizophagus irregularis]|uniref:Uncharacterized protein n=1 Tax=Rhizophagus irregularis TaxID=588596 RepID=A0A2N0NR32_9GLOM|nr:hypothetical protein RhiirA5_433840 [Rhizophagus irregularis]PKB98399.1 hypothetical protein RhiirA5_431437 [Rhizophagus irregularis]
MVFQFLLPEVISENPELTRELNINTQIFGISKEMHDIIFKINEIFIKLGRKLLPLNVVILEPSGFPNDDNEILRATEMYRKDFSLDENDFLDICADEAIFRQLIKCRNKSENIWPILGQWHTSKNMMNALITLFSSYGIYDLATALGVKFLDKFAAIIDYRSTRRVLELIWVAVGAAINIYLQKNKIKIEEILSCSTNKRICIRIWYLYYEWSAFFPLFPAAEKSNYATSVTHFLANLKKYPLLEKKLHLCASINLAREEHYPAFDKALETHGVTLLSKILLEIHKNSPLQLNQEGLIRINQAYTDGLKRIKEIYRQEVIKTEAINTKGRRILSVVKTKISELPKNKKPKIKGNLKRTNIKLDDQENVENESQIKCQRTITTEEEKQILSCLLQKETIPTEAKINEVLSKLLQE